LELVRAKVRNPINLAHKLAVINLTASYMQKVKVPTVNMLSHSSTTLWSVLISVYMALSRQ